MEVCLCFKKKQHIGHVQFVSSSGCITRHPYKETVYTSFSICFFLCKPLLAQSCSNVRRDFKFNCSSSLDGYKSSGNMFTYKCFVWDHHIMDTSFGERIARILERLATVRTCVSVACQGTSESFFALLVPWLSTARWPWHVPALFQANKACA